MYDDDKNKLRLLRNKIVVGYLKKRFKLVRNLINPKLFFAQHISDLLEIQVITFLSWQVLFYFTSHAATAPSTK